MDEFMTNTSHHIGFISTRFVGTDGVSLEKALEYTQYSNAFSLPANL